MNPGTARLSSGILGDENMFDPTQTQPLSWRMHQGKPTPWEEVPIDPPDRQEPSFDAPPDRLLLVLGLLAPTRERSAGR